MEFPFLSSEHLMIDDIVWFIGCIVLYVLSDAAIYLADGVMIFYVILRF